MRHEKNMNWINYSFDIRTNKSNSPTTMSLTCKAQLKNIEKTNDK
jgi:hypothetical protein